MIRTDHHSLKYFLSHRAITHFQQKWVSELFGFDYEIHYKAGHEYVVADALSRMHGMSTKKDLGAISLLECFSISYPYGGWLDDIQRYNEKDEWVIQKTREVLDN